MLKDYLVIKRGSSSDGKKDVEKKYELFSNQLEEEPTDDMQNPLNIRCTLIIKEKLKSIDPDL